MKLKKLEKRKNYYSEKNPTKLSWPMSAKSDKFFIQKEKKKYKIAMAHECQIWYLVIRLFIYNEIKIFLDRL